MKNSHLVTLIALLLCTGTLLMSSEQGQVYEQRALSENGDSVMVTFGLDYARARHETFEEPYEFVLDDYGCERVPIIDAKKAKQIVNGEMNIRPALYRTVVRFYEEEQEKKREAKRTRKRTCLRNLAQALANDESETKTP